MVRVRPSGERGHFDHGWLDTYHSFSFGDYYDPSHMSFRSLRVLNEDYIGPSSAFPRHGHRDMEIITLVLSGALAHKDSLGNASTILPGEVQRMTAGTGVLHSEANPSATDPIHLLQIWITPDRTGHTPGYEQIAVDPAETLDRFRLVASNDGREGSVTVHQDVALYLTRLSAGADLTHDLAPGRHAWLQVIRGSLTVNGNPLQAGDGAALSGEPSVSVHADADAEVLLFDLA